MDMSALLVIIQPTYVALESLARIEQYFSGQRLIKLTCINESGPVLLIPSFEEFTCVYSTRTF